MDAVTIKSTNGRYTCDECKNENIIPESVQIGDIVECEYCGIEYKVVDLDEEGNFTLELLEEEK